MFKQFIVNRFQSLSRGNFNGKLNIESESGQKWIFFFSQGRLTWAKDGYHPERRWRRQLMQHNPAIALSSMVFRSHDTLQCMQYHALGILLKRQQLTQEQIVAIITDTIVEVLWDIIQQGSNQQLNYTINQQKVLEPPLTLINTEEALKQAIQSWEAWESSGLAKVSPNLAPVLKKPEELQQQTSAAVYKNFVTLINGNYSLRDLSVQMKQDLLLLSRSLIPYIRKGIIGLIEVTDLPPLTSTIITDSNPPAVGVAPPTNKPLTPLIACVDDSPQTCLMMEQIFTQAGFRFISIQDSVQALPTLLERKPDLIFLDLMMPVVNGYEICSQLRRISIFAQTPMIILTGSDGLVDRVRAKVVGASEFLSKPVEAQKVLAVVSKYLSTPTEAIKETNLQLAQTTLERS